MRQFQGTLLRRNSCWRFTFLVALLFTPYAATHELAKNTELTAAKKNARIKRLPSKVQWSSKLFLTGISHLQFQPSSLIDRRLLLRGW